MRKAVVFALCLLSGAQQQAGAQQQVSDMDIMRLKAESAEFAARYLAALFQREEAAAKALRDWWAAYVAGLKCAG